MKSKPRKVIKEFWMYKKTTSSTGSIVKIGQVIIPLCEVDFGDMYKEYVWFLTSTGSVRYAHRDVIAGHTAFL